MQHHCSASRHCRAGPASRGRGAVKGFRRLAGLACSALPVTNSVLRLHVMVPNSVSEGSARLVASARDWPDGSRNGKRGGRGVRLAGLESWRKKTPRVADWRHMASQAGDEIRTHDIHVGNVTLYH